MTPRAEARPGSSAIAVAPWAVVAVALPASGGLLLSAIANRLSFLGCGLLAAVVGAVVLSRAARPAAATLALGVAGAAGLALGAIGLVEHEALGTGLAALLGGEGAPWAPIAIAIAGATTLAAAGGNALLARRANDEPPPHEIDGRGGS